YQNQGINIDLNDIPLDDAATFKLLSSGETTGIFQLEGTGMRRYIKELKPTVFGDIAAMVALYRPGPMEHIPTFIKAKNGEIPIRYPHPSLASILEETYGVIVYQEQVLFISQAIAGYSLGQADILRKAMGKKIPEVMRQQQDNFLNGAKEKGFSAEVANEIFALILPFAGYAFNKAHAVSYALIAYQTAYLKANYPAEYITASLIANSGQPERVANAVAECRRLDISVLQPDIQHSQENFSIERSNGQAAAIRFGLAAIKNVGPGAVEPIIAERNKGSEFTSIEDFCRRCDLHGLNKRVMESLIKVGAFDSLGDRGTLLNSVNSIMSLAQREQQLRETGQSTMFDIWGETTALPMPSLEMETATASDKERAGWEKELMGLSFSKQPFSPGSNSKTTLCVAIDTEMNGQTITIVGEVVTAIPSFTKANKPFVSATLEDISGTVEVVVWSNVYEGTRELWEKGNLVLITGKVRLRNDGAQLNCDKVERYRPDAGQSEEVAARPIQEAPSVVEAVVPVKTVVPEPATANNCRLVISISQTDNQENDAVRVRKLNEVIREFTGTDEVVLRVENGTQVNDVRLNTTGYCPELYERLVGLVGNEGVRVETPA
ncbi:MAG: DNA polymerase III subunit alpha, partial [Dehalococcoidales bacterium]|nr:DNA polymerase III subunit alpha [Dehalococcoidales bacterium]